MSDQMVTEMHAYPGNGTDAASRDAESSDDVPMTERSDLMDHDYTPTTTLDVTIDAVAAVGAVPASYVTVTTTNDDVSTITDGSVQQQLLLTGCDDRWRNLLNQCVTFEEQVSDSMVVQTNDPIGVGLLKIRSMDTDVMRETLISIHRSFYSCPFQRVQLLRERVASARRLHPTQLEQREQEDVDVCSDLYRLTQQKKYMIVAPHNSVLLRMGAWNGEFDVDTYDSPHELDIKLRALFMHEAYKLPEVVLIVLNHAYEQADLETAMREVTHHANNLLNNDPRPITSLYVTTDPIPLRHSTVHPYSQLKAANMQKNLMYWTLMNEVPANVAVCTPISGCVGDVHPFVSVFQAGQSQTQGVFKYALMSITENN